MTIEELREEVVKRGKTAAMRDYGRPDQTHKLRGALSGFDRCLKIPLNPEQWEAVIANLETELHELRKPDATEKDIEKYWEKRCYQAEVQWTFSVLCIGWKWGNSISCRASMTYGEIVGVAGE